MADLPDLHFDDLPELDFSNSKKSMFSSVEEGRKATQQAQKEQKVAQFMSSSPMVALSALNQSMEKPTQMLGEATNAATWGVPGIASELLSGGKLVNPLTHGMRVTEGGINIYEGKDLSAGQKLGSELVGSIMPTSLPRTALKVLGVEKALGNVAKYGKAENRLALEGKFKNDMMRYTNDLSNIFGGEYENIIKNSDKEINVGTAVKTWLEDHGDQIMQNEEFRKALSANNPQAKNLYRMMQSVVKDGGAIPEKMSAQGADALQKFIKDLPGLKGKISQVYKNGYADFTNSERVTLDLANKIKNEIIDSHPDLSSLNEFYAKGKTYIKDLRELSKGKSDTLINNLREYNPSKGRIDHIDAAAKEILSKGTYKEIKDFHSANSLFELLKKLGIGAATVGSGAELGRVTLQHHL